jgi:type IV secretion system protein VirB4
MIPMRENWVAQASWFSQFPTYDKFPRVYRLLSKAVACLVDFNKQPTGLSKSDWAKEPITMFTTAQGTSYQFQFHINEDEGAVGHTIAIGPTGQGKTTLYSFLASQAMRFDRLKTFFFDRHRGAEIFTFAVDGDYITFENNNKQVKKADEDIGGNGGRKAQLNPLKIEDTAENRGFIRNWLKEITLLKDSKSEKEIGRAVTTIFDYLAPEQRTLKNIFKSVFSPTGLMRQEMEKWIDPNQYGYIFNSDEDTLNLSNRFNTFDFTYILDDSTLAPAVISYIMNRIQNMTGRTGDPSLIIIDETAPMLSNPMFRQNFAIGLQEGRKKRQVYLAAFQQPNIIDKLGIGELIRGQAQTEIFFRNTQAVLDDYENWNFTTKEYAFIKGELYRDLKYAILFRKPSQNESVILNVDISGLGPYIQLFNSGRKNVLLAEEIRKKHDINFVKYYLEQFKK